MEQKKVVQKVVKKSVNKNENNLLDKLKKNWKNILLILLIIFSMSKCTSSCSRGREINRLNVQIEQLDSIVVAKGIEYDKQSIELQGVKTSIDSYKGIATGNQKELVDKVTSLTEENRNLTNKVNSLNKENKKLKEKIDELEKQKEDMN